VIRSFRDKEAERLYNRQSSRIYKDVERVAFRKLRMIHEALRLQDLRVPPANRLEALKGDRKGQYSIRINDQYRVCFVWEDGNAYEVEIVDYHNRG
jgi:proteic killer suppression protein